MADFTCQTDESEVETLKIKDDTEEMWKGLHELKQDGVLCDMTLDIDGVKFPIHKAVLACKSRFFRFLFTTGFVDTGESKITLPNMNASTMEILLNYMYCRPPGITMDNVFHIYPFADSLYIKGLAEYCCSFMKSELSLTNCVGILKFGEMYEQKDLCSSTRRYILDNFSSISQISREFLEMSQEDILSFICDDTINVHSEEEIFEAVMGWINYKATERVPSIVDFLKHIRLGLVQPEYFLENISNHSYIKNTPGTEESMSRAWEFIYNLEREGGSQEIDLSNIMVRPRIPKDVLFAVGGWSGGSPISFFESYDTRADRWYTHSILEDKSPRAYHGLVAMDGYIYIMGGFDGNVYFNNMRRFDPLEKTWEDVAPMYIKRCYVSAVELEGCIYAIGGYDGRQRMKSVEKYCPKTNQWSMVADLNYKRSDAGADVLDDKIYVVGGFCGDRCLNSAEVYDVTSNQWSLVTQMTSRRSGVSLIAHQGYLFALGGFNGERRLATGEKYCPETKCWNPIPEMYAPRSNFAAAVLDDMIFVIGGFNGTFTTPHVECFDGDSGEWFDATDMNVNRSALKACVLPSLSNVKDYTYYGHSESSKSATDNKSSGDGDAWED